MIRQQMVNPGALHLKNSLYVWKYKEGATSSQQKTVHIKTVLGKQESLYGEQAPVLCDKESWQIVVDKKIDLSYSDMQTKGASTQGESFDG